MTTQAHFSIRSCLKEKNSPIFSLTHSVPHGGKCLNQMHCLAHCERLQFSLGKPFRVAFKQSEWDTNVKDVSSVYCNRKTRTLSTEHGSSSTTYNFQQEVCRGKQMQLPYTFTGWPAVPKVVLCGKLFHFCKKKQCREKGSVPLCSPAHSELAAKAGLQFPMPGGERPDSYKHLFLNACTARCKCRNLSRGGQEEDADSFLWTEVLWLLVRRCRIVPSPVAATFEGRFAGLRLSENNSNCNFCRERMQRRDAKRWVWMGDESFACCWAEMENKITLKKVCNMMDLELIGSFAGLESSPVKVEHLSFLVWAGKVLEHSSVGFCH